MATVQAFWRVELLAVCPHCETDEDYGTHVPGMYGDAVSGCTVTCPCCDQEFDLVSDSYVP